MSVTARVGRGCRSEHGKANKQCCLCVDRQEGPFGQRQRCPWKTPPSVGGRQSQQGLPDSRNTPLCRAPRLSINMFFHVKPLVAR